MEKYNTIKVSQIQTDYLFESMEQASSFIKNISKINIPYDTVTLNRTVTKVYFYG